eukprot:511458_1
MTLLLLCFLSIVEGWTPTQCGFNTNQITKWGKMVDPNNTLPDYPRPQMIRYNSYMSLNGLWDFNATTNSKIKQPLPYRNITEEPFSSEILVPFPVESCLSGIGINYQHLSYRTTFNDFKSRNKSSTRVLLQFGAIDWQSNIYLNGKLIGNHTGGYSSFYFDITNDIISTNNELMISVYDPSDNGYQPNGKQRISAINHPSGDTYTPSSGIWQTVWLEIINHPKMYIQSYKIYPTLSSISINVSICCDNTAQVSPLILSVIDPSINKIITTQKGNGNHMIKIDIPNPKLWDPFNKSPFLYNLNISLDNSNESVMAYFGLREITLGQYNISDIPDTGPQIGIDRGGDDMTGYPIKLNNSNYNICWNLCNITIGCTAWAYAIPGCDNYKSPMCWLKNGYPAPAPNKCRVSGAEIIPGGKQVRPLLNGKPLFIAGWLDQSF